MSRRVSPFVRHLGEAKHRTRQLLISAERLEEAAIAAAGLSTDHAPLQAAIADLRYQVAMLEAQALRWASESLESS